MFYNTSALVTMFSSADYKTTCFFYDIKFRPKKKKYMQSKARFKFRDTLNNNVEVIPVHNKDDFSGKQNYRSVSIWSNLSKVFEKLIYSQLNTYMSENFSKCLAEYHKNNTEHALLNMIEHWECNLNNRTEIGRYLYGVA